MIRRGCSTCELVTEHEYIGPTPGSRFGLYVLLRCRSCGGRDDYPTPPALPPGRRPLPIALSGFAASYYRNRGG